MIGTSLGPYRILESLGAGGMGEVYLGEDTRLGRKVAIKVLPAQFAGMPDRLARFEQEARAAAALNHPHIAVVHDIGHEPLVGARDGAESASGEPSGTAGSDLKPAGLDAGEAAAAPAATGDGQLVHFMVQEYLEGEPLRELLDRGRLSLTQALHFAVEICEGLTAAHAAGILHRDLKPANIFITRQEHAKILDFGLAKLTELSVVGGSADPELSASPTVLGTLAGQVMGTAGYMSPEQVSGQQIDQRADVFSFGCVLFEMASGRRAFDGETVLDTLHAIARSEPVSLAEIDARLPAELQRILKKCLAKDRNLRYQGAQDLLVDLRALAIEVEAGRAIPVGASMAGVGVDGPLVAEAAAAGRSGRGLPLLLALPIAAALIAAASGITWLATRAEPPDLNTKRFVVGLPENVEFGGFHPFAVSPDGRQLAYVGAGPEGTRLYLRSFDQLEAREVAGTQGADQPFFSPDGDWIGFFQGPELKKVSTAGGQPMSLTRLAGGNYLGAAWGRDDTIFFSNGAGRIAKVQAAGGVAEALSTPDAAQTEVAHLSPQMLPDGRALLFTIFSGSSNTAIGLLDLETGAHVKLLEPGLQPTYLPTGHIAYSLDGSLWVVPFDAGRRQITGQPAPVINGVQMLQGVVSHVAFAADGTLLYLKGGTSSVRPIMAWLDFSGAITPLPPPPRGGDIWTPRLSPDETRIAYRLDDDEGNRNIWVMDIDRGISSLLTPDGGARSFAWTPDGKWIYYSAEKVGDTAGAGDPSAGAAVGAQAAGTAAGGAQPGDAAAGGDAAVGTGTDIYRRAADLSSPPEDVLVVPGNQLVRSISPDGEWLLYANNDVLSTGEYDIALLSLTEGGAPRMLFDSPEREQTGVFSPDGRWVAYVAETTSVREIYVQSFPNLGGVTQVSRGGGIEPAWSKDGDRLFYRSDTNDDLMVVEVLAREPIAFSSPSVAIPNAFVAGVQNAGTYDIARDGQRALFIRVEGDEEDAEAPPATLEVVVNWFQELARLAPPGGSR
jgi:serine/threonine-protein kinase